MNIFQIVFLEIHRTLLKLVQKFGEVAHHGQQKGKQKVSKIVLPYSCIKYLEVEIGRNISLTTVTYMKNNFENIQRRFMQMKQISNG